jgi:hypothetical protein
VLAGRSLDVAQKKIERGEERQQDDCVVDDVVALADREIAGLRWASRRRLSHSRQQIPGAEIKRARLAVVRDSDPEEFVLLGQTGRRSACALDQPDRDEAAERIGQAIYAVIRAAAERRPLRSP